MLSCEYCEIFKKKPNLKNIWERLLLDCQEAVVQWCSAKKVFLEISQNSQENTCARVSFFNKVAGVPATLLKKETLAQVFPCEFCKISKNTFFYRTPLVAAFNCAKAKDQILFILLITVQYTILH